MKDNTFEEKSRVVVAKAVSDKKKYEYTYAAETIRLNNHTTVRPAEMSDEQIADLLEKHPYMKSYFRII